MEVTWNWRSGRGERGASRRGKPSFLPQRQNKTYISLCKKLGIERTTFSSGSTNHFT